jgi:hypothetical protein
LTKKRLNGYFTDLLEKQELVEEKK